MYRKSLGHDPNSTGKVPILVDGESIITESDITSLYLAEKYEQQGTQDLIPKDLIERFKMREFVNRFGKLINVFYSHVGWCKKTPEEQEALFKKSE